MVQSRFMVAVLALCCLVFTNQVEATQVPTKHKGPESVSDLAAGLLDAVVNISTSQVFKPTEQGDDVQPPKRLDGSPFQEFFDDFFNNSETKSGLPSRKVQSLGSGFVVDAKQGLIVTNNHVIADADDIEANFTDGSKLKAKLLGKDLKTDLALLKVDVGHKKLTEVRFGNSEEARIGDWVMAVGNPFGFGGSVTLGIISARNRDINAGPYDDFIQTDASINRGNSGGPLFDVDGKVIGINTAIVSPSGGSIGIGFAIPSELAIGVINQLKTFGETRRGWLAIRIQPVSQDIADSLHLESAYGALVSGKIADTKADNSALEDGDVIVRFATKDIKNARDLPRIVAESPANQTVDVVVIRKGQKKTVKVRLGLLDEKSTEVLEGTDATEEGEDNAFHKPPTSQMGLQLAPLTPELRKRFKVKDGVEGVLITGVTINSTAYQKRIRKGDVIVNINQEKAKTPEGAEKRLETLRGLGRKNVQLVIANSRGELRVVMVRMDY